MRNLETACSNSIQTLLSLCLYCNDCQSIRIIQKLYIVSAQITRCIQKALFFSSPSPSPLLSISSSSSSSSPIFCCHHPALLNLAGVEQPAMNGKTMILRKLKKKLLWCMQCETCYNLLRKLPLNIKTVVCISILFSSMWGY